MLDTRKLVIDFSNGDVEAHHFFFQLHQAELNHLAVQHIGDSKQGIRIVHEIAAKTWYRDNTSLQSTADIKALYFITLKNTCAEYLRYKSDEKYRALRERLETFFTPISLTAADARSIENSSPEVIQKARAVLRLAVSKLATEENIGIQIGVAVGEVNHYLDIARRSIQLILSENL